MVHGQIIVMKYIFLEKKPSNKKMSLLRRKFKFDFIEKNEKGTLICESNDEGNLYDFDIIEWCGHPKLTEEEENYLWDLTTKDEIMYSLVRKFDCILCEEQEDEKESYIVYSKFYLRPDLEESYVVKSFVRNYIKDIIKTINEKSN